MPTYRPLTLTIAVLLAAATAGTASARNGWSDDAEAAGSSRTRGDTHLPTRFRRVALDSDALAETTRTSRGTTRRVMDLPLPDGGQTQFELEDAGVLPPGLAARFPQMLSMKGHDAEGRSVRLDVTADGVHASVSDATGDWIVRPETATTPQGRSSRRSHVVFRRADAPASQRVEDARMHEAVASLPPTATIARGSDAGTILRTFRIAMSATGSYTEHMGGRVDDGLAGVVRTVNRINEVFERDLGVHLVLAEGNDRIVFTHADDPFAGSESDWAIAMRNVEVAEQHLGKAAFDVGHALDGRSDGGVAGTIGNTCQPWFGNIAQSKNTKAAGMTGSTRPFEDAFHVDFVAHELGHQFGASHTFNGCSRSATLEPSPFEPASGSTVMGYAGICGPYDLQARTDPYFHAASIEQVQSWLASKGGSCAKTSVNALPAPFLNLKGWNKPLVVPARTPFGLSGSASFAAPAARLTYAFEQMDLGEAQTETILSDHGSGPLFRSRAPGTESRQTFPSMAVLTGDEPLGRGDAFPETSRDLHFRMTVRDNMDHRSHVVSADRVVKVVDTGAAFAITAPAAGAVLRKGKTRPVRWNVAGTRRAPIACDAVRIDLSLDGGRTFLDAALAESVPNTGRATVTVPADTPSSRRGLLRASCVDGAFFALSPGEVDIR